MVPRPLRFFDWFWCKLNNSLVPAQDRPCSPKRGSQFWPQLSAAPCPCGHPLQRAGCQTWGCRTGRNTHRTAGRTTFEGIGYQSLFQNKNNHKLDKLTWSGTTRAVFEGTLSAWFVTQNIGNGPR